MRAQVTYLLLVSLMSLPHAASLDNPRWSDTLCYWESEPSLMAPERRCAVCCTTHVYALSKSGPLKDGDPPPTSPGFRCCISGGCIP